MNTNTNNNTQAAAIAAIEAITNAAIAAIKAIMTEAIAEEATTAETTAATEATTEEDNTEFEGSMIENDPCDPMLSAEDAVQEIAADTADEETTEKMLDDIIADISALYDIAEYSLRHEGKNISTDNSPYSPKDNVVGSIDCYNVYISKEVVKGDHVEGSFRMIIKDKVIVNPIMELELRLIDNHFKVFSSENTHRMEKMKESHEIMRFLEITDEVSALVMNRYIAD